MANAVLSCVLCDRAKGDRTVEEWKRDLLAGLFSIGGPGGIYLPVIQ